MLAATAEEQTPLTKQLNTLTLWIAAAAGLTMIVMFALGLTARPDGRDALFMSAVALAIAAIPEALPTVAPGDALARRRRARRSAKAIVKDLRLGRDARFDVGDQLGQDRHADDEPDDRGRGASTRPTATRSPASATASRAQVQHAAGTSDTIDDAILPYVVASDAKLVGRQGRRRSDRGRAAGARPTRRAWTSTRRRERFPRLATLPFDPTYKLMAAFNSADGRVGQGASCAASSRARRRP